VVPGSVKLGGKSGVCGFIADGCTAFSVPTASLDP
jgi:hypothetical protein